MTAPLSMRAFTAAIFGTSARLRIVVMVRAAFDASMDSPIGITAVAGYLGLPEQWDRVEEKWGNLLALHQLDRFRSTEIVHRFGIDRFAEIACDFAGAMSAGRGIQSVCAYMRDQDWLALDQGAEYAAIHPERQHACLGMVLDVIATAVQDKFRDLPISVVFDNDYGNTARAARVYEAWRERTGHPGFDSITFIKGKNEWEVVPLQCADMFAGLTRLTPYSRSQLDGFWGPAAVGNDLPKMTRALMRAMGSGHGRMWSLAIAAAVERANREVSERRSHD